MASIPEVDPEVWSVYEIVIKSEADKTELGLLVEKWDKSLATRVRISGESLIVTSGRRKIELAEVSKHVSKLIDDGCAFYIINLGKDEVIPVEVIPR